MVNKMEIEKRLNELNGKIEAANMLNTIVIGILAAYSAPIKADLKFALDQILSSGMQLPGDFKARTADLLSHVLGSSSKDPKETAPFLRLIRQNQPESGDPHHEE